MKISARLFWAIIICILFFAKGCSMDTPTEPEKEVVIVEKCNDTYIRAARYPVFWSIDYKRVFTYGKYINLTNSVDNLENVGVAFADRDVERVFYVAQGGFFEVLGNGGYVFDEVSQAEPGQSLWIYSYMLSDSIPDGVRDITWVNLEWSKNVSFDSVKVAVNRNYDKLGKGLVEKKIGLWKGKEWLEH